MPKTQNIVWMVLIAGAVVFGFEHYKKTHS